MILIISPLFCILSKKEGATLLEKIGIGRTFFAPPEAATLLESMRNMGYNLESAIADIIDNSLTAGASTIDIFADINNAEIKLGILDNGTGMTETELLNAMRLGSTNPLSERNTYDLGRFGLGLKTASFSQCRKLTVVTKQKGFITSAIWDLDIVQEKNQWLVQIPSDIDSIPHIHELGESGTLVLWEKLDRITEKQTQEIAVREFTRKIDEAREHLELVFHRYLSNEGNRKKIIMRINGQPLEPYDPFNLSHSATIIGPIEEIKIGGQKVLVQAFTLPHHSKVSPAEWKRYSGKGGYLKNQGFYVYRNKRLILHGSWFGLAPKKELTKLARVKIDMPNGLDSEWQIDVKKASAQPPIQVRNKLKKLLETIGAKSKRIYTGRGKKLVSENKLPVWNRVQADNKIFYQINVDHPSIKNFSYRLPEHMKSEFVGILELASNTLPMEALLADLGGNPENVIPNEISEENLVYTIRTTVEQLLSKGVSKEQIFEMLNLAEPFKSNLDKTEQILERLFAEDCLNE